MAAAAVRACSLGAQGRVAEWEKRERLQARLEALQQQPQPQPPLDKAQAPQPQRAAAYAQPSPKAAGAGAAPGAREAVERGGAERASVASGGRPHAPAAAAPAEWLSASEAAAPAPHSGGGGGGGNGANGAEGGLIVEEIAHGDGKLEQVWANERPLCL